MLFRSLKCLQGRSVVNSISLKEGEEPFLRQAKLARRYGAAVIVMAFDEQGQAASFADKVRICVRAYGILTQEAGVDPQDIIFDPNILTIGTGMKEHDRYALDFIEAVAEIKRRCPGARTSGGLSNVSFGLNPAARQVLNSVFLHECIDAGLDSAIVHASKILPMSKIDDEQRHVALDLVYDRRSGQPLTAGYYGARIATHLDAPDVEVIFIESDDGYGPYGAKSIGEAGIILCPAAINNAIFNAIGKRLKDLPITRDKILGALA